MSNDPYYIDAWTLARAAEFIGALNDAIRKSTLSFDPSYGGLSRDHMLIGDVRWDHEREQFVLDVRHQ